MITLYHHAFCPHSRFVRLVLGRIRAGAGTRRGAALGAAARVPAAERGRGDAVLIEEPAPSGSGRRHDRRISRRDPRSRHGRAAPDARRPRRAAIEVRRLTHWFNAKFYSEVSQWLVIGEDLQALPDVEPGRRRARHGGRARGAREYALPSANTSGTSSGPATGSRAIASATPIWRRRRICRAWIIWATRRGARTRRPRHGTRG